MLGQKAHGAAGPGGAVASQELQGAEKAFAGRNDVIKKTEIG